MPRRRPQRCPTGSANCADRSTAGHLLPAGRVCGRAAGRQESGRRRAGHRFPALAGIPGLGAGRNVRVSGRFRRAVAGRPGSSSHRWQPRRPNWTRPSLRPTGRPGYPPGRTCWKAEQAPMMATAATTPAAQRRAAPGAPADGPPPGSTARGGSAGAARASGLAGRRRYPGDHVRAVLLLSGRVVGQSGADPRRRRRSSRGGRRARQTAGAAHRAVHRLAGRGVRGVCRGTRPARSICVVPLPISRANSGSCPGHCAVRAADHRCRAGVSHLVRGGWPARIVGLGRLGRGDPHRARFPQLCGGGAHGRIELGAPGQPPGGSRAQPRCRTGPGFRHR